MKSFLGETVLDIQNTNYSTYSSQDWVMLWIEMYGQIDGSHHKAWLIDQISRILKGTKVIVKVAKWDDGQQEERFILDEPSSEYNQWVETFYDEDFETNPYYKGIAP